MPAFNFQKRFAAAVESGEKRQTIRATRKRRPMPGETAHCFTGMRTRECRRLGSWTIIGVAHVALDVSGIRLNGGPLPADKLDEFARMDGFKDWPEMRAWFVDTHELPFLGLLVQWE